MRKKARAFVREVFPHRTPRAPERASRAVKYGTLFNLMFQSLAGLLVSLSVNYKVATRITLIFLPPTPSSLAFPSVLSSFCSFSARADTSGVRQAC